MKRNLSIGCIVLVLTACVADLRYQWYQEGVSREDTKTAYANCVYKVGMNKVDPAKEERLVSACMQSQGFRWVAR